jgi:TRAP-type C4-dicarboxylate transport system substrate-binding protein
MNREYRPSLTRPRGPAWRSALTAVAALGALIAAGCTAAGASKSGGAPQTAPHGTTVLTFGTANTVAVDSKFMSLVAKDSQGHLKLHMRPYDSFATNVDQKVAADLRSGKLAIGDVGSRAWENLGVEAFRAYQEPFLVTSRSMLDNAITGPLESGLLAELRPAKITGLAIVPDSIRYVFSTRPLTSPQQFVGAKIRINESPTTSEIITALGATPVTSVRGGVPAAQALQDGALTAIEASPATAMENGYLKAARYVVVNAPLFAKTTTLAASSAVMARLPAQDVSWLREAAQQAAASQANSSADRLDWASMCGQGVKPLAITPQQLDALHAAESTTYADLAGDPPTTLAVARLGGLATRAPRMDPWATCHSVGVTGSATPKLDGTYKVTVSPADVASVNSCGDCGNDGHYTIVQKNGRYAIFHVNPPDTNHAEPSVSFYDSWRPNDPIEVGTLTEAGNRVILNAETGQQFGADGPAVMTFEVFRDHLTWHGVSGTVWKELYTIHPWQRVR